MRNEPMIIGMTVGGSDPIASLEKVESLDIATCQMYVPPEEWWVKDHLELIKKNDAGKRSKDNCSGLSFRGGRMG